jgi:hypothetical protein
MNNAQALEAILARTALRQDDLDGSFNSGLISEDEFDTKLAELRSDLTYWFNTDLCSGLTRNFFDSLYYRLYNEYVFRGKQLQEAS